MDNIILSDVFWNSKFFTMSLKNIDKTLINGAIEFSDKPSRPSKSLIDIKILGITLNTTNIFTSLIKKYHLSHNIQIADCLIASICIANNLPLFTLNTKHFRYIPNLKLISHNIKPIKIPFES